MAGLRGGLTRNEADTLDWINEEGSVWQEECRSRALDMLLDKKLVEIVDDFVSLTEAGLSMVSVQVPKKRGRK